MYVNLPTWRSMSRVSALALIGALGLLAAGCCNDNACSGPLTINVDRAAIPPGGDIRIHANGTLVDCSIDNSPYNSMCSSSERAGSRTYHISFRPKTVLIERLDANGDIVGSVEQRPKYNDRSGRDSCSEDCDRRATIEFGLPLSP